MSGLHRNHKKSTNFTIAHILADKHADLSTSNHQSDDHCTESDSSDNNNQNLQLNNKLELDINVSQSEIYQDNSTSSTFPKDSFEKNNLYWLHCTRYRPPKLPRKSLSGKIFRKPATHPRIPFTTFQLEILEEKYKKNAYLSRKDVLQLSSILNLPHNRIKIWFQNRRARDRRDHQSEKSSISSIESSN